ncbi:LysR family transcriptional regulator [Hydrogenophaga pseudoflava]|uniref:LysR family transcriptional regulator n=1 Tax=Hydrogenophaga pseudoflava TaxID=47421 RepID=UPI0027E3ED4E|nr:LysR family transcriptional regulator [Hydrogenophaga pseudoflava]MDQ7743101.1 LysR family transcriptional regulator [Hydrogenophaga pseudoflava]
MKLSHRQIEFFRAVMGTGHVTRAAELLHTSQPTVSRELGRLEQVLGFALFERVKGRLKPTVRALALMEEVEQSYVGLERIAATAVALKGYAHGRLQLACLPALSHALLPDAVRRFALKQPEAAVGLTPIESPQLEAALSEQRFDLGLSERHEAPAGCTLDTLLVADEVAVLPAAHALARKAVLSLADFAGESFISFAPADPYRQQVDALFAKAGVGRELRLETPSAVSVCALVRQGLGLGIVNPLTALELAGDGAGGGLVVRPLGVSIPFHVALIRPSWRTPHPLRADFEAALAEAAAALRSRLASAAQA